MRRFPAISLCMVALLGGCGPFSILDAAGLQSSWLATLGWILIVLMSLVTVVMAVLVVWGVLRRRGRLDEHLSISDQSGKRWILYGGVAVPVVVLTTLFGVTLVTLDSFPAESARKPVLTIAVRAHQWWWEATYQFSDPSLSFSTANELHIPVGRPVRVELQSADVIHSFWVPRLHGKMDVIPGQTNALVLEAKQAGTYRGLCAEYCGAQHARMRFEVVAEAPGGFRDWAARQRRPAVAPSTDRLVKGREAFETHACAMCHRIRGTKARGGIAPDLTHFGSRETIAGVMPNTRARLQAWIVNAQGFKPGARMPSLEQFDGETLNALAAYLESLE